MRLSLAVLVSLVVALSACSKKKQLSHAAVEREVAAAVSALVAPVASASCPDKLEAKAGATFRCTASFTGGGAMPVEVRQLDGAGKLEVHVTDAWLLGSEIGSDLTLDFLAIGKTIQVTCPDAVVPVSGATTYQCQSTEGTTRSNVTVSVDASGTATLALQ